MDSKCIIKCMCLWFIYVKICNHIRPGHLKCVITSTCLGTHLNENWHAGDCMPHEAIFNKNFFSS